MCVAYSMWVALARLLSLSLTIIRLVIAGLVQVLHFPRWISSDIFLRKDFTVFLETFLLDD